MIKFEGRIVQFGFGAVGKSFYEKLSREIKFNENKYYVITANPDEFHAYINLGGMTENFKTCEVTRENFREVFGPYLGEGDLLIDFADTVGTGDICAWCAKQNIMYLNTGEADWPDHWYCIFEENEKKRALQREYSRTEGKCKYPIVLQHGNNPGLVSHFVKAGIAYIAQKQFRGDKTLKTLVRQGKFNEAAQALGLRMIHVNDVDLQEISDAYSDKNLYSTWCTDSFWFEMLSEATASIGTHEETDYKEECNFVDKEAGKLEFQKLAADKKGKTYYPGGVFTGHLVPHEETITIAQNLEVKEKGKVVYRPTVLFLYEPCAHASRYFAQAKVNDYPNPDPLKPADCEVPGGRTIIRGYEYPQKFEIVYQEKIASGTEYVGVLFLGEKFKPVWVGNRVETDYLYKNKRDSYWQTPTITPVAMSALAAVCWMLKHKDKGGIYFPDDIPEYASIIKTAEKYISKTIYRTFSKEEVEEALQVELEKVQLRDVLL